MLATDPELPNDLRWLLALGSIHLQPWFLFRARYEYDFATKAFAEEDVARRSVLTCARRHDGDDLAGLEIVDGTITSRAVYFSPCVRLIVDAGNKFADMGHMLRHLF